MKIIEDGRTPNSRRVRIFLAEKSVPMTFEQIDINAGDHMQPAFSELNPMRRVPVLVLDDGAAIAESVAICRYFDEIVPEPALMGRGARDAAMVEMWQRRMENELFFPVTQSFRHRHPAMAQMENPQVPAWGEACADRAIRMLPVLDDRLKDSAFVAGDEFTIADITALVAIDFMKPAKLAVPEGLDHLARWRGTVQARPSASA